MRICQKSLKSNHIKRTNIYIRIKLSTTSKQENEDNNNLRDLQILDKIMFGHYL